MGGFGFLLTGRCVGLGFLKLVKGYLKDGIQLQRKLLNEDLDAWFARLCYLERRGESSER